MDDFNLHLWPRFAQNHTEDCFIDQVAIDSRRIASPKSLFIALKGERTDGHRYVQQALESGAKYAIVSREFPESTFESLLIRVDSPLQALQEIAGIYRSHCSAKVVAITGSYGKTLLKDLLQAFCSALYKTSASPESFNSQIGVALSLLNISRTDQLALIEAGISQPGEMERLAKMIQPDCAIITTIGEAHIATMGNLDTIRNEKIKILHAGLKWSLSPSTVCSNFERNFAWDKDNSNLPSIQVQEDYSLSASRYVVHFPDGNQFLGEIPLGHPYFIALLAMAVKAAWLLDIPAAIIKQVLQEYQIEPMRTEVWKSPQKTLFINHSYCSDLLSLESSLTHMTSIARGRKLLIFDGLKQTGDKYATSKQIGRVLAGGSLNCLFSYGTGQNEPYEEYLPTTTIIRTATFSEALQQLQHAMQPGDTVLIKGSKKQPFELLLQTFNDSACQNQCLVNLANIKENLSRLCIQSPNTRFMPMIKASAYGTDDARLANFLVHNGIDIQGVSYVEEAVALRRSGVQQAIFTLNGAPYEASIIVKFDLEVAVSHSEMINRLQIEAAKAQKLIKVHLHLDTGMSRFGCRPDDCLPLAQLIAASPNLQFEGIMTHFACADIPEEDSFTLEQIRKFDEAIALLAQYGLYPKWRHAANTSALTRFSLPQYNMARIGLALYGLYPSEAVKQALKLKPALTLTSRIVGINVCKKGDSISYGRSYKVAKDEEKIAIIPIGYFDGLHRNYSGKGTVLVNNCLAPMVGRICMDFSMIDVTGIPNVQIGDQVLLFGEADNGTYLAPEALAENGGSIIHELITCLGPRIERVFINEN